MATSAKPQFLLLIHQPGGGTPPPDELKQIMARFGEWMSRMQAQGAVLGTNGLETTGKVLRGKRGATITDGPYAEGKEVIGGYVLIQADNEAAAVELARDCPGLDYGLAIEVRPVRSRPSA